MVLLVARMFWELGFRREGRGITGEIADESRRGSRG